PADSDDRLTLGDECSGIIVDVGEGVHEFAPGDEVIASTRGCLSSFVTTNAVLVIRKPVHLTFEEAAAIPVVFTTAYYALHILGRMAQGERVLIQAGAGGVGLAAIQLAQRAGAEVFATAGSPEKRAFLQMLGVKHVMDSRSLSFADEVMDLTHGGGVDIVLNSLAGEAIQKGLSCLAPFGRFIEIGTRDIYQNTKLGMRPFKNSISFISANPKVFTERPTLIRTCMDEVVRLFEKRELHAPPHRVFALGDVVNAFRHMAQAKHIGKIVVSFHNEEVAVEPHYEQSVRLKDNTSYLITGGLGGFGLATAEWMTANGARHIALMGRSATINNEAQQAIARMESKGTQVLVVRGDVAVEEDVTRVLDQVKASLPPLRGIIHAAMVLDDGVLLQLTSDRFRTAMRPKILGAWNLHNATLDTPLDLFVLYSSVATIAGNPGQGNYVAANAFLDFIAHYRKQHGLPALYIAWGH
ncbi:MAG: SDR family NAD(P)-dependent oxidoreductase, partial [Bacteroidota bacterium]